MMDRRFSASELARLLLFLEPLDECRTAMVGQIAALSSLAAGFCMTSVDTLGKAGASGVFQHMRV